MICAHFAPVEAFPYLTHPRAGHVASLQPLWQLHWRALARVWLWASTANGLLDSQVFALVGHGRGQPAISVLG